MRPRWGAPIACHVSHMYLSDCMGVVTDVDPCLVVLVPHLKAINLILEQHGDGAKVGVGADAARQLLVRIRRLRGVMQQSHRRNGAVHELGEVILLQVQRQGQNPHQVGRQAQRGVVVLHRLGAEALQLAPEGLRPLVRPAVQPLVDEVGVRLRDLVADVEALLQLGLRALLEDLGPDALVAPVPGVVLLGDLLLALQGQGEELLGPLHHGLLQLERDGVPHDLEEAIVEAALADLVDDLVLLRGVSGVEACMGSENEQSVGSACGGLPGYERESCIPEKSMMGISSLPMFNENEI